MADYLDIFDLMIDPKKHGYEQCDHCNGYGSSLKEDSDRCTKCGGMGLVKKEEYPVCIKCGKGVITAYHPTKIFHRCPNSNADSEECFYTPTEWLKENEKEE